MLGLRLIPGESYPIKYKGILTINQATEPKDGKTMLKVQAKGQTFVLCSLVKDHVERQVLSHTFIAEDNATLIITGANPVNIVGSLLEDLEGYSSDDGEEDEEEEEEEETISGQPRYPAYLSDLLGPDLPEDDDEDYEDDEDDDEEQGDNHGSLAFRDPTDNEFLGGFELSHFQLVPSIPGYDDIDLRQDEQDMNETFLNDNIATGLVNALLNSGDKSQIKKGKTLLKKLKKQCEERE
ncbi:hypothetical protein INT47_000883 [Mucor saturninus]|uniref:Nucleoplasmin-like domain-containing protein n=1 Tax=Mucor saturninus TaxID=64648 RepID=A0A8H7VD16_9FUNG|nr:hypothetical protein INT47_000883 [Mucor saturninus]